ncbi:hypothetical protein ACFQDF_24095 [Ectobacillus funiculus]
MKIIFLRPGEPANVEEKGILFVGDVEMNRHQVDGVRFVSVRDEDTCKLSIIGSPKE